ncbi:CRAL/TRIO domain containing protein [Planoprotostelium fungivorum]|uniref:CRAL/TRIO domain containing protein n=1 Tax=Planoprotostelium fungivorum TaxID=1890364 RepID=A0A2P6MQZ3_9EUKA|nr:CRAL/TRIO domain containing protein [Planoprotostelium fungivorum]
MSAINYTAWDTNIQNAIVALPEPGANQKFTRAQAFVRTFPDCLTRFRTKIESPEYASQLAIPLADWQRHPTYLLRFLLAEWADEATGKNRTDIEAIMNVSAERVKVSQEWRSGKTGDNWTEWGYKDMDTFYSQYKTPPAEREAVNRWFFQRFYGTDKLGRPVHFELLPNTFDEKLMLHVIQRRMINNEHTLRVRMPSLNPAEGPYHDPIMGVTWVLDARQLSMWASASLYKTMNGMLSYTKTYTAAHYPEQGYRALVVNLGSLLITLYNLAMKVLPAQTRNTTSCYGGNEILGEAVGWENVPGMFKTGATELDMTQEEKERSGALPWERE